MEYYFIIKIAKRPIGDRARGGAEYIYLATQIARLSVVNVTLSCNKHGLLQPQADTSITVSAG